MFNRVIKILILFSINIILIELLKFFQLATPIVPVVKANGIILLCADYSVTLNKNLRIQRHPLPKTEEISALLSVGKIF